jgi:hypothetical protein
VTVSLFGGLNGARKSTDLADSSSKQALQLTWQLFVLELAHFWLKTISMQSQLLEAAQKLF